MRFAVLGPLQVLDAAHEEVGIRPGTATRLLCLLLAHTPDAVGLERLCERLWWGNPPPAAVATVRANVHWLRRVLGADRIRTTREPTTYGVRVLPGELDVDEFRHLSVRGQQAFRSGSTDRAFALYEEALTLWRGRPFLDLGSDADITKVVRELDIRRGEALGDYVDAGLSLGKHAELLPKLTKLTAEFPNEERLRGQLMLALHRAGKMSEAIEAYGEFKAHAYEELGVEPSDELHELHYAIARRDPKLDLAASSTRHAEPMPKPAQLPPRISGFTGRRAELATVSALAAEGSETVVIIALDGMAGVGKTVLARQAGHLLSDHFTDGQIFLDLHGFTGGVPAVDALTALEHGLSGLGVPAERLPHSLDGRAALWRSLLAGKRFLIVLDNARDEEQVRPLLPASPGAMVLVTSRRRLSGLEDAEHVSVDVLPSTDAAELFRHIVGTERPRTEPSELVDVIVRQCGFLPLAIRIVASRFATRHAWRLADLVDLLNEAGGRLAQLTAGSDSVPRAFEVSYGELAEPQQRTFSLLALQPGADFDAYTTAAVAGLTLTTAQQLLEELVDVHLLETHQFGRYRFHDLLRSYANELASRIEPEAEREAASNRLLDFYLDTAAHAMALYNAGPDQIASTDWSAGSSLELVDAGQAVKWLNTERSNLFALIAGEEHTARASEVLRLAEVLEAYTYRYGHTPEALAIEQVALRVARQAPDQRSEALVLARIGAIHTKLTQFSEALRCLGAAQELVRAHDDDMAAARVHEAFGHIAGWTGRYASAAEAHLEAAERYRRAANLPRSIVSSAAAGLALSYLGQFDRAESLAMEALTEARTIDNSIAEGFCHLCLGRICLDSGRHEEALEHGLSAVRRDRPGRPDTYPVAIIAAALRELGRFEESVEQCERVIASAAESDDRGSTSMGQLELGRTLVAMGEPASAIQQLEQALELLPDGARQGGASIHRALGDAYVALADVPGALVHYEVACAVFTDIGAFEATGLAARIHALRGAQPS